MAAPSQQTDSITATLELRARKAKDLQYQKLPLLDGFRSIAGGTDKIDGGAEKAYEVIVKPHAGIIEHVDGYEGRTTSVQEVSKLARFYFYMLSTLIALTKKDDLENAGKAQQLKILEMRMVSQMGHVMRTMERHMLQNESVFSNIKSLDGMTTIGIAAGGHLEDDAIGSQTNTIGTLARQTYTPYLDNQVVDIASDFAANGVEQINMLMTKTWSYAAPGAGKMLGLFSEILFNKYMTEMGTQVRLVQRDKLDVGNVELVTAHGHKIRPTPNLGYTADGGDKISGIMLDIGGHFLIVNKRADWTIAPPRETDQQLAMSRDMLWHGQLGFQHGMRGSGVILNGEA